MSNKLREFGDKCPECGVSEIGNCAHFPTTEEQDEILRTAFYAYMEDEESSYQWSIKLAASVFDLSKLRGFVIEACRGYSSEMTLEQQLLHYTAGIIRDAVELEGEDSSFAYATYVKFAHLVLETLSARNESIQLIKSVIRETLQNEKPVFGFMSQLDMLKEITNILSQFNSTKLSNIHFANAEEARDIYIAFKLVNFMMKEFYGNSYCKAHIYQMIRATGLFDDTYDHQAVTDYIDDIRTDHLPWYCADGNQPA